MPVSSIPRSAYRAFISYSHRDKAWADWLHKALETWRVPSRLVGVTTAHGEIPRRLNPVFRDREELASATDLGRKVNEALAQSENLVVICSPASAASRWVNEEVLAYKRMGRGERIFCLIVDGEPDASEMPGRQPEECFCPALRFKLDANGRPTTEPTEPIAADARPGKDGKANAKLKLIAGMLDIGFDALKQREQQRRVRRMTWVAALAVAVMAVTSVLAMYALLSRHAAVLARHKAVVAQQAAQRRQKQAEGLVSFMLGDLNDKLNQVHRLDIMQAVDEKALTYFDSLPPADATDTALVMRVKALDKIGMVMTEAHGQLANAMRAYRSAAALAGELARRAPGNAGRQAAWADSLNMVGVAYWQEGDFDNALRYWQHTATLLQTAHVAKPDDRKIASSLAGVSNNIGHVLEARGEYATAQTEYDTTLQLYQKLSQHEPANAEWLADVGWSWDALGKLATERGQLERAVSDYVHDQRIKAALAAKNTSDYAAAADLVAANAILGRALALCGEIDTGLRYTHQAVSQARSLVAYDATNTQWQVYLGLYSMQAGGFLRQTGRLAAAQATDEHAVQILSRLLKKDPISDAFQQYLAQAQLESARLQLAEGDAAAAEGLLRSAQDTIRERHAQSASDRAALLLEAQSFLLLGQAAFQSGDKTTAQRDWVQARALLQPALGRGNDPHFLTAYTESLLRLGQVGTAQPTIAKLDAMGFRTPDFLALLTERHLDYPVNAAFQQRIAKVMVPEAPPVESRTAAKRLAVLTKSGTQ